MEEKLDRLIVYLCDYIESISKKTLEYTPGNVAENVGTLAELVSARASLK